MVLRLVLEWRSKHRRGNRPSRLVVGFLPYRSGWSLVLQRQRRVCLPPELQPSVGQVRRLGLSPCSLSQLALADVRSIAASRLAKNSPLDCFCSASRSLSVRKLLKPSAYAEVRVRTAYSLTPPTEPYRENRKISCKVLLCFARYFFYRYGSTGSHKDCERTSCCTYFCLNIPLAKKAK